MVSFGFFNSSNGDRKYSADDVSRIFSYLITDGVLMTYGDKFFTTPATANLGVVLGTGWAWFNHTWTQSDTAIPFTLDEPDPSLDRFDTVYLKVDRRSLGRMNSLGVVKGTAAINPVPPTFPTETDVFYHPLAYVKVRHGVTRIAASDIEILSGKTQAPFITSILQTTDITTLFQGWSEQFGTKMNEWEAEIDALETSLTSNVNAVITSANQQLQTQQTQFTTQLANQQTTFTNSLNGWETDFQTWFDNLQTYLSEDVVTEIWADLQALETKNAEQDTAIANKLAIAAKATSTQVSDATSGTIWIDPAQAKTIAENAKTRTIIQVPNGAYQLSFIKGTNNSLVTTDAISFTWSNSGSTVSSSGIIVQPYDSVTFCGGFSSTGTFDYVITKYGKPIYKYAVAVETKTYVSGTVKARFIWGNVDNGLLLIQCRTDSGELVIKPILIYTSIQSSTICPSIATSTVGDLDSFRLAYLDSGIFIYNVRVYNSRVYIDYIYTTSSSTVAKKDMELCALPSTGTVITNTMYTRSFGGSNPTLCILVQHSTTSITGIRAMISKPSTGTIASYSNSTYSYTPSQALYSSGIHAITYPPSSGRIQGVIHSVDASNNYKIHVVYSTSIMFTLSGTAANHYRSFFRYTFVNSSICYFDFFYLLGGVSSSNVSYVKKSSVLVIEQISNSANHLASSIDMTTDRIMAIQGVSGPSGPSIVYGNVLCCSVFSTYATIAVYDNVATITSFHNYGSNNYFLKG